MIEIIKKIVANVLVALYEPFGFAIIMAVLFMIAYLYVQEKGIKQLTQNLWNEFKKNDNFRRIFILVFYTALILFRTLLNRKIWSNTIANVIGVWRLYNENGELTTEVIENFVLFIPFTILVLWCFREKILGQTVKFFNTIWKTVKLVFLFSVSIEFLQLFMRLGTFQLSDIVYNTLGGLVGGLIYWCGYKIVHSRKKDSWK